MKKNKRVRRAAIIRRYYMKMRQQLPTRRAKPSGDDSLMADRSGVKSEIEHCLAIQAGVHEVSSSDDDSSLTFAATIRDGVNDFSSEESCSLISIRGGVNDLSSDDDSSMMEEFDDEESSHSDLEYEDELSSVHVGFQFQPHNPDVLALQLAYSNPRGARYNMDAALPTPEVQRHFLGDMNTVCSYCNAIGFAFEKKGTRINSHFGRLCCNGGKSKFPNYPFLLPDLYLGNDGRAKYFRKNIRYFNSGMAMASMKAENDKTVRRNGPGIYRISDVLYRRLGAITAYEGCSNPRFVQTYFYSPQEQSTHRSTRGSQVCIGEARNNNTSATATTNNQHPQTMDKEIFDILRKVLVDDCNNSYLRSFYTLNDFIRMHRLNPEEVQIELVEADNLPFSGYHAGRLRLPEAPEVALLIDPDFVEASERPFICSMRNPQGRDQDRVQVFPVHHRSYIPMAYPLLFPYGTHGWGRFTCNIDGKPSTHLMFLRYHLMSRSGHQNFLHLGRKLFQQLIVDEYERLEFSRLQFIRRNQREIRAELYGRLTMLTTLGTGPNIGRPVILPATVTGSDRWYVKQYRNAMALVRVLGKPTLFLTCTLDTGCTEVKSYLQPGQVCYDRPDLLNRVFHAKYTEIIHEVTKDNLFGRCIGFVSSVEFQKRGAPHVHMIIWLENFQVTPHNINNIISAEIPRMGVEGTQQRRLHDLVIDKMIHGPCGFGHNTRLACRPPGNNNLTCLKNFPKSFNPSTVIVDDSYPLYRRRAPDDPSGGGHVGYKFIQGQRQKVDNRWVVPYSPYLLLKYGCHCNLEFCNNIQSVKYLFKYQMKGGDMVTVRLPSGQEIHDEIHQYTHKRYISATYAHWRILEYPLVQMVPSVMKLKIHDLGQHEVYFQPNSNAVQYEVNNSSQTMLTDYFAANACPLRGSYACELLYEDFPTKFTWNSSTKQWTKRVRNVLLYGRMDNIHPANVELFHLRLLLKHRRGMTSFDELKTVDGINMGSYRAAAIALNLCQNDQNYIDCLNDARIYSMPSALRQLFCSILTQCFPTDPRTLMLKFKFDLMEDFSRVRRQTESNEHMVLDLSYNDLLFDIRSRIAEVGLTMLDLGLDEPDESLTVLGVPSSEVEDESINAQSYYDNNISKLTETQERLFGIIATHIDNSSGGLYTIDAPGGCGKTFLCNVLLAYARMHNKIAIATALSGIAATLMRNGTTFHRRFGAPCNCTYTSTSSIKPGSKEAIHIEKASIIFVDEVSMMNRNLLDFLDRFLQSIMNSDLPMGGKLVVLMHDFRQLLPVVKHGSRGDIVHSCVTFSKAWPYFKTLQLNTNMRVELLRMNNDLVRSQLLQMHSKWLLSVGEGTLDYAIPNSNIFEIPSQMVCNSVTELETKVYSDLQQHYMDPEYLRDRAIMSCTNDVIQECNQRIVASLPGQAVICESTYRFVNDNDNLRHDIGSLRCINPSGLPPHLLQLKVGTCIILIRNLNIKEGHCNGTRYIILSLTRRCIRAKKLNSMGDGNDEIFIPRIPLHSNESDYPVPFVRTQFPVLVSYYLTISRAQGQTFKQAGMYLPRNVFAHGHMYVGMSRCGDPNGLHVFADQGEFKHVSHMLHESKSYSKNVVYSEMLS